LTNSPPRRGGVARSSSPIGRSLNRSAAKRFCRSDHPVCAASVASRHFLSGASSPPLRGGEYVTVITKRSTKCLVAPNLPGSTLAIKLRAGGNDGERSFDRTRRQRGLAGSEPPRSPLIRRTICRALCRQSRTSSRTYRPERVGDHDSAGRKNRAA